MCNCAKCCNSEYTFLELPKKKTIIGVRDVYTFTKVIMVNCDASDLPLLEHFGTVQSADRKYHGDNAYKLIVDARFNFDEIVTFFKTA